MHPSMATQNVLAVVLEEGLEPNLRSALASRGNGEPRVHVVVPAHVGPLQWYATDEDEAHAEAEARVRNVERALADEADVHGEAGEADPVLAVEDALRSFSADEIVLVGGADAGLERSLRRFGLPIARIPARAAPARPSRLRETVRALASGRSKATPFVVFLAVNLVLLALSGVIALVVLFVLWLL
jgi:hypothetical protein